MEEKSNHLCASTNFLPFLITISVLISSIDCQPAYVYHTCSGSANKSANANFNSNLSFLLDSLSSNATLNSFFTDSFNGLYGLYLCRGDISSYSCQVCVSNATRAVQELCPSNDTAIIWFDTCMLRYSNVNFIGKAETDLIVFVNNVENTTTPGRDFGAVGLINTLISNALDTDMMFNASGSERDGYGLVQCTRDINKTGCTSCFNQLINNCCQEKIGWRLLAPSCNIRYEKYLFYQQASAPVPKTPEGVTVNEGKSGTNTTTIVIIVVSSIAATGALLSFCYCSYSRKKKRRQREGERSQVIRLGNRQGSSHINLMEEGVSVTEGDDNGEMHYFDLKTIQAATNNFSAADKLGEGRFGPVYKGKLQNGKEIAVKRLSMRSRQGLEEFRNEVLVIAKLQHKNLVRLLGYCWEADEKLLVYEYLANKSLDTFLFDQKRCKELDWTKRANIITGTARGLLYLHEDSRLKIIHRDLKASNVLLDDDMNPKISDFGTARIFGGNQIEANTDRVVGTYGYMAPEYALEGLISTKSDVYSFGILVLEIISGKKNRGFYNPEHGQSFLLHAWQLWSEDKGKELIDLNIVYNCPITEALRWIHISLLCVQDDPALRPTMSQVVLMIGSKSVNLPPLSRAPFTINTTVTMSDQSSGFGSSSLLISDQSTDNASV